MSHLSRLESLRWIGNSLVLSFTLRPTARGPRRAESTVAGWDTADNRVEVFVCGDDDGHRSLPVTWGMRSVSRHGGSRLGAQCFVGEAVLTPVDAGTGEVLTGTWEVYSALATRGTVSIQRMSVGVVCRRIHRDAVPGFVGGARTYVEVGLTNEAGLVVRIGQPVRYSLYPGVTVPRFKREVGCADDGAAIRLPLRVHLAHNLPVSTTLVLTPMNAESSAAIRVRAIIVGPQSPQPACLIATVPGDAFHPIGNAQSWALHAEFGDALTRLNHTLSHGGEPDPKLYLGPTITGENIRRCLHVVRLGVRRVVTRLPRVRPGPRS